MINCTVFLPPSGRSTKTICSEERKGPNSIGDFTLQFPGTSERGMGLKSLRNLIMEMKKLLHAASSSFTDDEDLKLTFVRFLDGNLCFMCSDIYLFIFVTVLKNKTLIIIVA